MVGGEKGELESDVVTMPGLFFLSGILFQPIYLLRLWRFELLTIGYFVKDVRYVHHVNSRGNEAYYSTFGSSEQILAQASFDRVSH